MWGGTRKVVLAQYVCTQASQLLHQSKTQLRQPGGSFWLQIVQSTPSSLFSESEPWNHAGSCLRRLGQLVLSSVVVPCSSSLTNWSCISNLRHIHCLLLLHLDVAYGRSVFWHAFRLIVSSFPLLLASADALSPFLPISLALFWSFSALPLQLLSFFVLCSCSHS